MQNQPNVVASGQLDFLQRLRGTLTFSRPAFDDIAAYPTFAAPMLVVIAVSLLSYYLIGDIIIRAGLEHTGRLEMMSEAELATAVKEGRIKGMVSTLFSVPVSYLIMAAILMFVSNVLQGGTSSFRTMLAIVSWAGTVSVVSALVNIPYIMSAGVFQSATSLALLVDNPNSIVYFFLSQIDLFTIWAVVLYGIGLSAANGWESGKGVKVMLGLWGGYVLLMLGLRAMTV